jgi:hypothetical protein
VQVGEVPSLFVLERWQTGKNLKLIVRLIGEGSLKTLREPEDAAVQYEADTIVFSIFTKKIKFNQPEALTESEASLGFTM